MVWLFSAWYFAGAAAVEVALMDAFFQAHEAWILVFIIAGSVKFVFDVFDVMKWWSKE
jgi:hypothetical protein